MCAEYARRGSDGCAPGLFFPMVFRSPEGLRIQMMMNWLSIVPGDPSQLHPTLRLEIAAPIVDEVRIVKWDVKTTSFSGQVISPQFYRQVMEHHEERRRRNLPQGELGMYPPLAVVLGMQKVV